MADRRGRFCTVFVVNMPASEETAFCPCVGVLSVKEAVGHILDETRELVTGPSLDEISDVCFAAGRAIGALLGRAYVSVPFDARHREKMRVRMAEHGCVRSARHLVNGRCPSLPAPAVSYSEVESTTWHDEGGVKFPAWTVVVDFGDHTTTYWFQTEVGATRFREERRAG